MAAELVLDGDGQLAAQLGKHGLRKTAGRILVLQALHAHWPVPLVAERIFLAADQPGMGVTLGTVYRVLREFEQCGLVQREHTLAAVGKCSYLLSPAQPAPSSYHICCPCCAREHRVTDRLFLESMQRQAREGGFDASLGTTAINVVCNRCAAV